MDYLNIDIAIAGAGLSGLIAAYCFAKDGLKVAMLERQLCASGGMLLSGKKLAALIKNCIEN